MRRNASDEEPIDPAAIVRIGTVATVDLAAGTVQVETGDVLSAPIPFSTGRAGRTRAWSPPSEGEQVLLVCPEGDLEAAVALGALSSDRFPLPGNGLRELLVFADGAEIAYDPDAHRFDILLPAGATARIEAPEGLTIIGPVRIEGEVFVAGALEARDDVTGGKVSLKDHVHGRVQAGTAVSGAPV